MGIEPFDDAVKEQLRKEDSEAWHAICTILLAIIAIGLGIAFLAIFLVA